MDIDFMISDTFEMLRPQLTIIPTYEQANEAVDRMLLEQLKSIQGTDKVQEDGFDESGEGSDTSSVEDEDEEANRLDEEDEEGQDEPQNAPAETDEDDVVVLKKKQEQISREDEEDFEREFNKMMTDSIESRKFEKKTAMLDVPIPMNLRGSLGKYTMILCII
jgi:regulator of nonsense transcripts 2